LITSLDRVFLEQVHEPIRFDTSQNKAVTLASGVRGPWIRENVQVATEEEHLVVVGVLEDRLEVRKRSVDRGIRLLIGQAIERDDRDFADALDGGGGGDPGPGPRRAEREVEGFSVAFRPCIRHFAERVA
jgi:hypothetical protein